MHLITINYLHSCSSCNWRRNSSDFRWEERTLENEMWLLQARCRISWGNGWIRHWNLRRDNHSLIRSSSLYSILKQPSPSHHAKHNLQSRARFEKGINKATIVQAGKRAAALIVELGGETVKEEFASAMLWLRITSCKHHSRTLKPSF